MPQVRFFPDQVLADVRTGTTLLASATACGVNVLHSCGGVGACTSCCLRIVAGAQNLSVIGKAEAEQLNESGIFYTHRLACQAAVLGDVDVERPLWRVSLSSPMAGE